MNKQILIGNIEDRSKESINYIFGVLEKFPWNNKAAYSNWLAQSYFYVAHTTRLLALAAARSNLQEHKFHLKFIAHAAEEKGHEKLCLNDLKALGHQASDFAELPQTSAIYHSLNYMIERESPCAIFGYALVLEGISAQRADPLLDRLTANYGKPATSFLRVHCEVDKEHSQETRAALENCEPHQLEVILRGIEMINYLYEGMLNGIQRQVASSTQRNVSSLGKAA